MPRSAVIRFCNSNQHNQYTLKALNSSISIIQEVRNVCDLGITFDLMPLFNEYIAHIVDKANSVIGLIKRSIQHID